MNENTLNNNALASMAQRAAPQVLHAIKNASAKTGVNFAYLMEQAAAESSFNEKSESTTSSATGLYQFIESTWMNMVKKHGEKYGLGDFSSQINDKGKVDDPEIRQEILDLRKNPEKAALLAAEFASDNKNYLTQHVGGEIGSTELYFAHFMGASGATGFLNAMKENPLSTAADLFPKAARANRNVFYGQKTGKARTLAGVYDFFDKKFGAGKTDTPEAPKNIAYKSKSYNYAAHMSAMKNPMTTENAISQFMSHPFLQQPHQENSYAWRAMPLSPLLSPVELMMMAQLESPARAENR